MRSNYSLAPPVRRSPTLTGITPTTPCPNQRLSFSEQSPPGSENIIDLMEREQDAIVLKLMKEIDHLKSENKALRQSLTATQTQSTTGVRRSSSMSSHRASSSVSSVSSQSSVPTQNNSRRHSALFNNYSLHDDPAKAKPEVKEVSPSARGASRSRRGSINNDIFEENKQLKLEIKKLRHELELRRG